MTSQSVAQAFAKETPHVSKRSEKATASPARPMRAIVYRSYGGPDVLEAADLPIPEPGEGQVLVRVRAASVNPLDFKIATGNFRPILRARFPQVPGYDVAGEVVRLGPGVTGYVGGTHIHAHVTSGGAAAEYALVPTADAASIPEGMDFATAAGLPLAGMTALQALRDAGGMPLHDAKQRVLVLGASGGVGHLAVQIACAAGATVIAVCSGRNRALVESLGAHEVIDYGAPNPYRDLAPCDIVLDCVGQTASTWLPHLAATGRFVSLAPGPALFLRSMVNWLGGRQVRPVFTKACAYDLRTLDELASAGKLRVVVDETVPLEKIRAAWERSMSGRTTGKLIVEVAAPA